MLCHSLIRVVFPLSVAGKRIHDFSPHGPNHPRAFDISGAVLGSIIALILFWYFKLEIKTILMIAAGVAFISLIPLLFVKDMPFKKNHNMRFGLKQLSPDLRKFLLINLSLR